LGSTFLRVGGMPVPHDNLAPYVESFWQEGAQLVLRYVPESGQVAWSEVVQVDPELVGLSLAELRATRPDWSILSFSPTRLVVDLRCVPQGPGGFLRAVEGHVAIFSGVPNGCHELLELTNISIDGLSEPAKDAVIRGIPFTDRADLPEIPEGLTSTQ